MQKDFSNLVGAALQNVIVACRHHHDPAMHFHQQQHFISGCSTLSSKLLKIFAKNALPFETAPEAPSVASSATERLSGFRQVQLQLFRLQVPLLDLVAREA